MRSTCKRFHLRNCYRKNKAIKLSSKYLRRFYRTITLSLSRHGWQSPSQIIPDSRSPLVFVSHSVPTSAMSCRTPTDSISQFLPNRQGALRGRRDLETRYSLFTSTHNEDQPCGDWFVTGGIRLPFLPTRWSATHTPNPSNSRRVRAAAYSSRIAVTGFRRIARCAGK